VRYFVETPDCKIEVLERDIIVGSVRDTIEVLERDIIVGSVRGMKDGFELDMAGWPIICDIDEMAFGSDPDMTGWEDPHCEVAGELHWETPDREAPLIVARVARTTATDFIFGEVGRSKGCLYCRGLLIKSR